MGREGETRGDGDASSSKMADPESPRGIHSIPGTAGLALASHHDTVAIVSMSWLIQTLNVLRTPRNPEELGGVEDARTAM